jgi:hypothetical protein
MLKKFKSLSMDEMKKVHGGDTREEYCGTLGELLVNGDYQGDYSWGMEVYYNNCGRYGISLPDCK